MHRIIYNSPSPKEKRELLTVEEGVAVVEQVLPQGRLNKVQEIIFRSSWAGQSYDEIAKSFDYDYGYIKDTGSKLWQLLTEALGEKVTKLNIKGVLQRYVKCRSVSTIQNPKSKIQNRVDWGEAIDVSIFYGRNDDLTTLQQWILESRCRLITLLGMGGIGKTSLSVKIAQQIVETQHVASFEFVIWRSLRDAPIIEELLISLISFLSHQQETKLPETLGGKLSCLVELLRKQRCLLILDNFDAILQSCERAGKYRQGYEGYGELLKRVGEIPHQSCVLLTSREKPAEVVALEGEMLPTRTLQLQGLEVAAAVDVLNTKGFFSTVELTSQLVEYYQGNPLALKICASSIRDLFAGDITTFLAEGTKVFNGIADLLMSQFQRLSNLEKQVMYWLAINREVVSLSELQRDISGGLSHIKLMETLESLRWRSLIESNSSGFTLQPVVMEYMTEQLIPQIVDEIISEELKLFISHPLIKATAKDYIRESQIRTILKPLIAQLLDVHTHKNL